VPTIVIGPAMIDSKYRIQPQPSLMVDAHA